MDAVAQHTFLFADLVGYTAFTEDAGDELAADVAIAFQDAARALAADFGCDVVKSLGDAVLIHGCDAARVVALALRIARELASERWCPALRMGVHSGTAVCRDGDWYGAAVNVASRLVDAAAEGEILISVATRELLASHGAMTIADRGVLRFKNVAAPVGVFAAAA
jgi:adenylate cyclase